jgi:hypothetical protein
MKSYSNIFAVASATFATIIIIFALTFTFALALPFGGSSITGIPIAHAASLTPASAPAANGYTLSDILGRLLTNTSATSGSHAFGATTTPQSTFPTLIQIYNAIPTIDASKFLSDTTYLGITGNISIKIGDNSATSSATSADTLLLTPDTGYYNGTTATVSTTSANFIASNIRSGANLFGIVGTLIEALGNAAASDVFSGKTFSNGTTANVTGALNLACNTATFDGTANLVSDTYDGTGSGTNRWCMKDTGTAVAGDILTGKKAWVNGLEVSGSVTAGANVTGTNGTLAMTIPNGLYSGSKTATANDTNLVQGNIKSGVSIFGVAGNVAQAIGNAGAGDVLAGKTFSSSTASNVTGTIPVKSGDANATLSATTTNKLILTPATGYYNGTTATVSTTSPGFDPANIKSGTYLFGITGTMTGGTDTSSGTAVAGDLANEKIAFTSSGQITGSMFTNQKNQTIDDWVNGGGTTTEYIAEEGSWSTVAGSPFAGNTSINFAGSGGDLDLISGIVKKDGRTGLWWSDISAVGASASSTSNVFAIPGSTGPGTGDGTRPTGGNAIGFCDALNTANFAGHNDWYLPTQKQLMQAYIDGSANNLPNPGYYFWSSTEYYNNTAYAWSVYLFVGGTYNYTKTTGYNVRCVRP